MFPAVKELLTNVVVKYVKHMVPPWKIADAIEFNAALRGGHAQTLDDVPLKHGDTAFLQVHGRHDRGGQGRRPDAWQPGGESSAGGRVDRA